jgi:TRAP-type uncharacterized transport system substrate-binding protein
MKKVFALLTLVAFVAITASAFGQAQPAPQGPADLVFKVSSAKGTYIQFAQQIAQVCSTPSISISTSDGQLGLYNDLIANKANVGMLTAPILIGKKTVELDTNVDKIVVIMPLYAAELHIVALRSNSQVNKFTDVGNKKVATYGGAFITSRIVLSQAQLRPFSLQDYKSEDLALQALVKGEADVVFIEVGQPATWAEQLNGNQFKLVEFDRTDLLGKNGFVKASLNYKNLSQTSIPTLGTQVYLVSQNYSGAKKVHDISALKECISKNIVTLREETGFHPKWSEVKPGAKSDWPMFKTTQVNDGPRKSKK